MLKFCIACLLFGACVTSFAQTSYFRNKSNIAVYRQLYWDWDTGSRFMTRTGAIGYYETRIKKALDDGDEHLAEEYELRRMKIIGVEIDDRVVPAYLDLLRRARADGNKHLEAEVLQLYAEYEGPILKKYVPAFENFLAAYDIYKQFTSDEFPAKQEYLMELGGIYRHFSDYENSIRYCKDALQTKGFDSRFIRPICNDIGFAYRSVHNYDSSNRYFRMVYDLAIANNDTVWIGIGAGNLGVNLFRQERYDEAVPLLEKDIGLNTIMGIKKEVALSSITLAQIRLLQGKIDEAERLLTNALSLGRQKQMWYDWQFANNLYSQLYRISLAKNQTDRATAYADSAMTAKDSVAAQSDNSNFLKTKEKFELMQHQMELSRLAGQEKLLVLIRNGLMLFIALITLIGLLFINRQRLKAKKLFAEKQMAEAELNNASRLLHNFKENVQEKNRMLEVFESELSRYKDIERSAEENETLIKLQQSTILTDQQWEDFRVMFEKVHKGFFKRVKDKMPDLTPGEIRFVALSKLKLSPKEMGSILGISPGSIRNYRLRLRRKLGLDDEASIEELADAI